MQQTVSFGFIYFNKIYNLLDFPKSVTAVKQLYAKIIFHAGYIFPVFKQIFLETNVWHWQESQKTVLIKSKKSTKIELYKKLITSSANKFLIEWKMPL